MRTYRVLLSTYLILVSQTLLATSPVYLSERRVFWFEKETLEPSADDLRELEALFAWGKECRSKPQVRVRSGTQRDDGTADDDRKLHSRAEMALRHATRWGFENVHVNIEPSRYGSARLQEQDEARPHYLSVAVICH